MLITSSDYEIILSTCINDKNMHNAVRKYLIPECFTDSMHIYTYRLLESYKLTYDSHPTKIELISMINPEDCSRIYVKPDAVRDLITTLCDQNLILEEVFKDKVRKVVLEYRMRNFLSKVVNDIQTNKSVYTDDMKDELVNLLDINFSSDEVDVITLDSFVEARNSIRGEDGGKIHQCYLSTLNTYMNDQGMLPGTVNMVVGPPGRGKSVFLLNEGLHSIKNGNKVLHIIIGDMTKYAIMTRYLAAALDMDQNKLALTSKKVLSDFFDSLNQVYQNLFDNLHLLIYPAASITAEELVSNVTKISNSKNVHYDEIIIDYPDNLAKPSGSMYESGRSIYGYIEKLAKTLNCIVWVASQPKINSWNSEIIEMSGASESSGKQHVVDLQLGLNSHGKGADFGTIFISKNRHGMSDKMIPYKLNGAKATMIEISTNEYLRLAKQYDEMNGETFIKKSSRKPNEKSNDDGVDTIEES